MKIERGRPIISRADDPATIAAVLRDSIALNNETGAINSEEGAWYHQALNNSESIEDHFGLFWDGTGRWTSEDPTVWSTEADCLLTMSRDQLEMALVLVGLRNLADNRGVTAIEDVLANLDETKQQ